MHTVYMNFVREPGRKIFELLHDKTNDILPAKPLPFK